jgi:ABC-type uncharacterized transport system ATPase subunit
LPLLAVKDLKKSFGGLAAVDGVSFDLASGALTALVGPNGCGKSTLFNLITGALAADGGRIIFDGNDITGLPAYRIARAGIGRKFQVPAVFDELTVLENLTAPKWVSKRLPLFSTPQAGDVGTILELVGLHDRREAWAGDLSHGQKQWLEIGMLLASPAHLLLLDEPTAGMTFDETARTADLLQQIIATGKHTVLVIEHDMGFVERLGCPVMVMARGKIMRSGAYRDLRQDPDIKELYFGQA